MKFSGRYASLTAALFLASVTAPMAQDAARNAQIAEILRANGAEFTSEALKSLDFAEDARPVQPQGIAAQPSAQVDG